MNKNLFFIILTLLSGSLQGQNLSMPQVKSDLILLKEMIGIYNPSLDLYNPDFRLKTDSLLSEITTDSVSMIRYFQYVSKVCALSNEGHFATGKWEDTVHIGFQKNIYKYLPVAVKVLNGKLYVWTDYSNEKPLNRGQEIFKINGTPAAKVVEQIRTSLSTDGKIKTYAYRNIEEGFPWLYYFYVGQPDFFEIEIKDKNGETTTRSIQALTRNLQVDNYRKYYPPQEKTEAPKNNEFYQLKYESKTAYLTLSSFDFRRVKDHKAKTFYKTIFTEFAEKGVQNLVIDLRSNTGGRREFAEEMVPYIISQPTSAAYLMRSISWKGKKKTYKVPKPSKVVFKGNIYVFVNGTTYSTGSTLARYLKEFTNAKMIGEETGTRYEGFSAGSKQYITLPNSKIRIGIPRYHMLFTDSEKQKTKNRGLLPDYEIEYTIEDLINEKDLYLETLREMIEK